MDMITLAMAKAYADKKGGYSESVEIKWDGNTDGRDSVPYQSITFYKVSDRIFTPEELGKATYTLADSYGPMEISNEAFSTFDSSELGLPARLFIGVLWKVANAPVMISGKAFNMGGFAIPSDGTYFAGLPQFSMYLQKLSFETIVPIDQKYLGGVCLPVVELSTEFAGAETVFSESDNALLSAVAEKQTPIILKMPMGGGSVMCVCNALVGMGFLFYTDMTYMLTSMDGSWSVMEA